jgi:hypothetical protein
VCVYVVPASARAAGKVSESVAFQVIKDTFDNNVLLPGSELKDAGRVVGDAKESDK